MDLLKGQQQISEQYRMPTKEMYAGINNPISSETVQLQYFDSGVLTTDVGQAAGVVVTAKLAHDVILDEGDTYVGSSLSTSFVFTTGTILVTLRKFDQKKAERDGNGTLESVAVAVTEGFANGEYCIDHSNGRIYGVKATAGTSDTAAYSTRSPITTLWTQIAGEDLVADVLKVEEQYTSIRCTADTLVLTGSGRLHKLAFSASGAVTAGLITVYDNTAESGTILWSGEIQGDIDPLQIDLNSPVATGIYVGYDASIANVQVVAAYRAD